MRFIHTTAMAAVVALLLCGATTTRAQVNGNATISSAVPVFGQSLTVSTSSQFAGAVSSIKWGSKEYINNWDHGRQLQLNSQFFNRFICYNPYEAGGFNDGRLSTTISRLLSLNASGNRLEATTQIDWCDTYHERLNAEDYCGDPAQWL